MGDRLREERSRGPPYLLFYLLVNWSGEAKRDEWFHTLSFHAYFLVLYSVNRFGISAVLWYHIPDCFAN